MKFEIGDTVKIINAAERQYVGLVGNIVDITSTVCVQFPNRPDYRYFDEQDLELVEQDSKPEIRKFDTGATRDTVGGKLSYVKILSPAALRRFAQYMMKHAKQSDGSMREPDNWKKGFPVDSYLDSLGRHFLAIWLLHDGFTEKDNHGDVTLEDSLCGIVFNSLGWLHVLMEEREKTDVKHSAQENFIPGENC